MEGCPGIDKVVGNGNMHDGNSPEIIRSRIFAVIICKRLSGGDNTLMIPSLSVQPQQPGFLTRHRPDSNEFTGADGK
ncbi:hypothetical protein A0256_14150 [Mucilaginibacter sp. PAMC 26640]|nr:hypothetical protein A0256_14150 [Mucilaginibacter sp. PAMC 26640]